MKTTTKVVGAGTILTLLLSLGFVAFNEIEVPHLYAVEILPSGDNGTHTIVGWRAQAITSEDELTIYEDVLFYPSPDYQDEIVRQEVYEHIYQSLVDADVTNFTYEEYEQALSRVIIEVE